MRITVIPEQLRQVAQSFRQAQSGWEEMGHRLRAQQSALDWEIRRQQAIEEQIGQALYLARALAEGAGERASWLEAVAARFEAADREAYQAPGVSFGRPSVPSIPQILGVWTGGGAARDLPITRLIPGAPLLGGLGVFALSATLLQPLGDLAERVWNWIHGYGWSTNAELAASSQPSVPKGQLADTIRRGFERIRASQSVSEKQGRVIQTLEVPAASQQHLEAQTSPKEPQLNDNVKPEYYDPKFGCVRYAQDRRPDLGIARGNGGAANYIEQHKGKLVNIEKDDNLREKIGRGYAIVWDFKHNWLPPWAKQYGHVAIVEKVIEENGEEYVLVSQAGVGSNTNVTTYLGPETSMWMKIPKSAFLKRDPSERLYIIGV